LPGKVRDAEAPLPPRAGRAWSTLGPHPIGAERFVAVASGTSFAQVAGANLGKQAQAQISDKDALYAGARPVGLPEPCRPPVMRSDPAGDAHG
jgi:hypothetical protein